MGTSVDEEKTDGKKDAEMQEGRHEDIEACRHGGMEAWRHGGMKSKRWKRKQRTRFAQKRARSPSVPSDLKLVVSIDPTVGVEGAFFFSNIWGRSVKMPHSVPAPIQTRSTRTITYLASQSNAAKHPYYRCHIVCEAIRQGQSLTVDSPSYNILSRRVYIEGCRPHNEIMRLK